MEYLYHPIQTINLIFLVEYKIIDTSCSIYFPYIFKASFCFVILLHPAVLRASLISESLNCLSGT